MKLFAVVAAATLASGYAACTITKDKEECDEKNCKYVIAVKKVEASGKDEFKCRIENPYVCKESATVKKYTVEADKKAACDAVEAGDTEATVKAKCTTAGGDPCVVYQSAVATTEVKEKSATCEPKACGDYPTEKGCKGESSCKWKPKVDKVAVKYKCKVADGLTDADKKTACEAVADATPPGCSKAANGGLSCCLTDFSTKAVAAVPARCADKTAAEKAADKAAADKAAADKAAADKAAADKKTCEEAADKKYVEAVTAVAASGKDEFKCTFQPLSECNGTASVSKTFDEAKKTACEGVAAGDTEATVKAKCTTEGGDRCVSVKTKSAVAEVTAVDAKCVAKACGDYATEEVCKGDECVWKAMVPAVVIKSKCKAQTGLADAGKKKKCEETVPGGAPDKCKVNDNGGASCCGFEVVTAPKSEIAARCAEKPKAAKETTDTPLSGVAVAMTSAFAAAAAGLLL